MNIESLINELKTKIQTTSTEPEVREAGSVLEVADGIAIVSGLQECMFGELLEFEGGVWGLAQNLEQETVGVVIFGDISLVKEGSRVVRTNRVLSVPVSQDMIGRVLNPFLQPIDGGVDIVAQAEYPVEKIAPGVMERQPVDMPLQTGIKAIDAMVPIGRGQRELIIGDRQTGKTTVAIDTILNQKGQNVICVYVAIGQKRSKVARIVAELEKAGAMEYTAVILAGASDGPAYSYIAPYAGTALAEYFMDLKKDVLIVYDDLTRHAVSYREISLLLRRPPGREAYPGDVFYLHSRLLERASRRNDQAGGGSITALPIIETQAGDISAYIPTNVISITDGQIFLEASLFNKGIRPAINIGNSVSRVGGAAQIKSMKKVAGKLRTQLAQYRELEAFAQFASDLDEATKRDLDRGERLTRLLIQPPYSPVSAPIQVAVFWAANNGYVDGLPVTKIKDWESEFTVFLQEKKPELLKEISSSWTEEVEIGLKTATDEFMDSYNNE